MIFALDTVDTSECKLIVETGAEYNFNIYRTNDESIALKLRLIYPVSDCVLIPHWAYCVAVRLLGQADLPENHGFFKNGIPAFIALLASVGTEGGIPMNGEELLKLARLFIERVE